MNSFERALFQIHPWQVLLSLAKWFRRSYFNENSLRTTNDGHHGITIAHNELKWNFERGYKFMRPIIDNLFVNFLFTTAGVT